MKLYGLRGEYTPSAFTSLPVVVRVLGNAAAPLTAEIMADIAKFTDIKPVIQVSSIEVDR